MNNYKPDLMDMGKTLHKIREEKVFSRAQERLMKLAVC